MQVCTKLALGLLVAGCSSGEAVHATVQRAAPEASTRISIAGADADVWSFRVVASGALDGPGTLQACVFEVGTVSTPARISARSFTAELALAPGDNVVSARCRTHAGSLLRSRTVRYSVRLQDRPRAQASARIEAGRVYLDGSQSRASEHSGRAIVAYQWSVRSAQPARGAAQVLGAGMQRTQALPSDPGPWLYELTVIDGAGMRDVGTALVEGPPQALAPRGSQEPPGWLAQAVVYGVFPPLFGQPPLQRVREAVPKLAALGVNTLWLSPVFATPPGDFGYAVTDALRVRADYGSREELARLVATAHAHGLRVLLDLVPNHSSAQHPYFEQAQRLGPQSHYYAFYDRDAQGLVTHYFDWKHLPNFDYDHPEVVRMQLFIGAYWPRELGVDGYRVDAAWGVKARRPEFWPVFRSELQRVRADVALIAEASARDPYYLTHGFDAAYDWTHEVGVWAWRDVFTQTPGIVTRLHEALMATAAQTGHPERVLRFLNNNDTGERFITRHGRGLTRVATAALLTLPGVPALYTFDEVGAEYQPYVRELPATIPEDDALRAFHARLIALRRTLPALQQGSLSPLLVDGERELFVYLRVDPAQPDAPVIVALNFSARPARVRIPWLMKTPARARAVQDLLGGVPARAHGQALTFQLPGFGAQIMRPRRRARAAACAPRRRNSRSCASARDAYRSPRSRHP